MCVTVSLKFCALMSFPPLPLATPTPGPITSLGVAFKWLRFNFQDLLHTHHNKIIIENRTPTLHKIVKFGFFIIERIEVLSLLWRHTIQKLATYALDLIPWPSETYSKAGPTVQDATALLWSVLFALSNTPCMAAAISWSGIAVLSVMGRILWLCHVCIMPQILILTTRIMTLRILNYVNKGSFHWMSPS